MKKAAFLPVLLLLFLCAAPCAGAEQIPSLLLMVYMTGSNLETDAGAASRDLDEMAAALPRDGSLEVLVMAAGARAWHNGMDPDTANIYLLTRDGCDAVLEQGPANMGDPETLRNFLSCCRERTEAERYALLLWDHGAGPMGGVCFDEKYASASSSMDCLTLAELREALRGSPFAREKLEWIGFDACLMASMETAWAVAPYARYLIASQENEPAEGWDYGFLSDLAGGADGARTGSLIVERYANAYKNSLADITLSCIALDRMEDIASAASAFFGSLDVTAETYPFLAACRTDSREIGSGVPFEYDLVDFIDLTEVYADAGAAGSEELLSLLRGSVVCSYSSGPYRNGLSLYCPFRNKAWYISPWGSRAAALAFSDGYSSFVDRFAGIWLGDALTDWSMAPLSQEQSEQAVRITLQLTPEQRAQAAGARLVVISENMAGHFFFCYETDQVNLREDGLAECLYRQESLYITDAQGHPVSGAVGYRIQGEDIIIPTILNRYFDLANMPDEWIKAVYMVYRRDQDGRWQLLHILEKNEDTQLWGKSTVRLEDWDYFSLIENGRRITRDENGSLLPFRNWEYSGSASGDDLELEELGLPCFLQLQDGEQRYAMLEITDLQNHTIISDLIPLPNPYRREIAFEGGSAEDELHFRIQITGITAVSGVYPELRILYEAENYTDAAIRIWLRNVSLNGVSTDKTYYGSSIRLQDNRHGISEMSLDPEDISQTGETLIRSIDFNAVCQWENGDTIVSIPVHLDVEFDARMLLGRQSGD